MKNTPNIIVESVIALSVEQTADLKKLLKSKFGTDSYEAKLTPELLGGLRITVGSTQYDASVANTLTQLGQA